MPTTISSNPYQREKLAITMPVEGTCTVPHGQTGRAAFAVAQLSQSDLDDDLGPATFRTNVNSGPFVRIYGPPGRKFDLTTLHIPGVTAEPAPASDLPAPIRNSAKKTAKKR